MKDLQDYSERTSRLGPRSPLVARGRREPWTSGPRTQLFVGDDRAAPAAQAGIAPDQPDRVEDGHHDEAQPRPREPVVGGSLTWLEQVVDGDGDDDHAEGRQHDVLDD